MGRGSSFKPLVPFGKAASKTLKPVTSLKLARKLTSKFHGLLALAEAASAPADKAQVAAEIAAMGGREAYQEASALATAAFRSSRFVFKSLVRFGLQPLRGEPPLRVLEVGAVNAQLSVCPWMRVRAIDLLSRHAAVETKDFFAVPVGSGPAENSGGASGSGGGARLDRLVVPAPSRLHAVDWAAAAAARPAAAPPPQQQPLQPQQYRAAAAALSRKRPRAEEAAPPPPLPPPPPPRRPRRAFGSGAVAPACAAAAPCVTGGYDVVVNAMVINCVMDPVRRAEMVLRCRDHLVEGGVLFLALPSRCLDMSQHLTRAMFEDFLCAAGLAFVDEKRTAKISFYMLRRADAPAGHAAASVGHGAAWRPRLRPADPAAAVLLARLAPPLRMLPKRDMPVTGFTRTAFALVVPEDWVAGRASSGVNAGASAGAGVGAGTAHGKGSALAAETQPDTGTEAEEARGPGAGGGGPRKKARKAQKSLRTET